LFPIGRVTYGIPAATCHGQVLNSANDAITKASGKAKLIAEMFLASIAIMGHAKPNKPNWKPI